MKSLVLCLQTRYNNVSKEFTKFMFQKNVKIFFAAQIFVIAFFFAGTTHKVLAQPIPVADFVTQANTTVVAANTSAEVEKEFILDGILKASMQVVISNLTNSIVTWINSGFQGNPAFIDDPAGYFTDVGDQVAGNFIAGTELGFLCQPFQLDIRVALAINYSSSFTQRNYCRLSDTINNTENFAKFTSGDFSQGGWNTWFEVTQNPSNNPIGAQFIAQTEMTKRIFDELNIKEEELSWGNGFLSYRDCLESDEETGECVKYSDIQTPGTVIESQLANTLGSGVRQLELADEINEIVGALVGQLVQTVFTEGLSSFSSSGSNYNSLQAAQGGQLTASCSPNRTTIALGEVVTWSAYVNGGSGGLTTYVWGGDQVEGATSNAVSTIYTDTGRKTASVTVTKGGQNLFRRCSSSVVVQ